MTTENNNATYEEPTYDELRAAAEVHISNAQNHEDAGDDDLAERHYERAQRVYEAAGIDADWFDDATRTNALREVFGTTEPRLKRVDLVDQLGPIAIPTGLVELTDEPDQEEITGIVMDPSGLRSIDTE